MTTENALNELRVTSPPLLAPASPIGRVAEVHGPVVDIACETLPPLHRALEVAMDGGSAVLEVLHHLDPRQVRAIALHPTAGLRRGTPVFDSGAPLRVPVSVECLGRLLDAFGAPLDGGPPLSSNEFRNLLSPPPLLSDTLPSSGILETGIKVIDLLCPFIRGGKTGLFGGAGVGKTVLILAPAEFFAELLDQYLLAALYGLLYESLAAESRQRLAHMEHALDRLDETVAHLGFERNALRQEKIVEEIEVILSSEQAFADRR